MALSRNQLEDTIELLEELVEGKPSAFSPAERVALLLALRKEHWAMSRVLRKRDQAEVARAEAEGRVQVCGPNQSGLPPEEVKALADAFMAKRKAGPKKADPVEKHKITRAASGLDLLNKLGLD